MSEVRTFSYTGHLGVCLPYDGKPGRVFDEQGHELDGVVSVEEADAPNEVLLIPKNKGTDEPSLWGVFTVTTIEPYQAA